MTTNGVVISWSCECVSVLLEVVVLGGDVY